MPNEDDYKDASKDGRRAYRDGVPLSDNPYHPQPFCALGQTWRRAWLSAKEWDEGCKDE